MKQALSIATLAFLFVGCVGSGESGKDADVIYTNGRIYTVNPVQPWAQAVAIKDGRFVKVGSDQEVMALAGEGTRRQDLQGAFVMPGLIDAHTHPFESQHQTMFEAGLDGSGEEALLASLEMYAGTHPDKAWITGGTWPIGMFRDDNPQRETLDAVVPDRPVMLIDQSGHSAWLNTQALELVGFMDPEFKTPPKYTIERDEKGVPSGTIREFAIGHVRRFIPEDPVEEWVETARGFQPLFHQYGLTATGIATAKEHHVKAARYLEDQGELQMHLSFYLEYEYFDSPLTTEEELEVIAGMDQYISDLVDPTGVKLFVDGTPLARQAWMLDPYKGTDITGISYYTAEQLTEQIIRFEKMNRRVMAHAIGDRAVRDVLDAIEAAKKANPSSKIRHHLSHSTLTHPQDIERLAGLDVGYDISPVMVLKPGLVELLDGLVGRDLLVRGWALRTAYDAGAMVAMATDWNVSPLDPWHAIGWTVSRINHDYPEMVDIAPHMKLTIEEAIQAYTVGAAYALARENEIGSIEEGKSADMAVLDRNLLETAPADLEATQVMKTVFRGKVVYERAR